MDRLQILIDIQSRLEGLDKAVAQTAQLNALAGDSVATARQQQVIEEQKRAIALSRFQLVSAEIAGEETQVKLLRDELAIRSATLGALRTTLFTEAELTQALAAQNLLLQTAGLKAEGLAAGAALSAAQLSKARSSAGALVQALNTGNVTAQGLGTTFASLGGSISIAAIAGFGLYSLIKNQVDETRALHEAYKKVADELDNVSKGWQTAATRAETFADSVKVAEKIKHDLDKMSADMAAFRAKELPLWQRFWDDIVAQAKAGGFDPFDITGAGAGPKDTGAGAFKSERDRQAQEEANRQAQEANRALDRNVQSTKDWAAAQANLKQGISDYTEKLKDAEFRLANIDAQRHLLPNSQSTIDAYVEELGVVEDLRKKVSELRDEKEKADKADKAASHKDYLSYLRAQRDILREIKAQQEAIAGDPFTSISGKHAAEIKILQDEAAQLRLTGHEWDAYAKLRQAAALTPAGELQADLAKWVNSFGSASHQIAGFIQNSITSSLQELNQWLLTGQGNVKQLGLHFAEMGLQILEQLALQQAASLLGITTTAAAQNTANIAQLSTAAPLAAAQSVASFGTSAVVGSALALAAIGAIIGALTGGFAAGGRTGVGPRLTTVGEEGEEFVFTAASTRNIGIDRLYAMMHAAESGYASGGRIGNVDLPPIAGGYNPGWVQINPGYNTTGAPDYHYGYGGGPVVQINPAGGPTSVSLGSGGSHGTRGGARVGPYFPPTTTTYYGGYNDTRLSGSAYDLASHLQNLQLMAQQAYGGAPNFTGTTQDTGHTIFTAQSRFHGLMDDGVIMQLPGGIYQTVFAHGLGAGNPNAYHGGFAGGGRYPGVASSVDNRLAHVATGETLINAGASAYWDRVEPGWYDRMNRAPRFASGGRASGSSGSTSGGGQAPQIHVYNFTEMDALLRHLSSTHGQKILIDVVNGRRIDLGFPA